MTEGPLEVDARGQRCPLPVITLAKAVRGLPPGSEVTLLATDPATRYDVPAWCRMRGHELVSTPDTDAAELRFVVRLRARRP